MSVRPFSSATIISAGLAFRGTALRGPALVLGPWGETMWKICVYIYIYMFMIVTGYRRLRLFLWFYDYNTIIILESSIMIRVASFSCSKHAAQNMLSIELLLFNELTHGSKHCVLVTNKFGWWSLFHHQPAILKYWISTKQNTGTTTTTTTTNTNTNTNTNATTNTNKWMISQNKRPNVHIFSMFKFPTSLASIANFRRLWLSHLPGLGCSHGSHDA